MPTAPPRNAPSAALLLCYYLFMLERRQFLMAGLVAATGLPARGTTLVRYPEFLPVAISQSAQYPVRMLKLVLSNQPFAVQSSELGMRQGRALAELQSGRNIDAFWTMTTKQRERDLLPVRIPLDMGLIGWRLLLIRKNDLARFAEIRSLDQLRRLKAVQGSDWPDVEILRANGFHVETAGDFSGMFKMLNSGRVDYFPRSVFEVQRDLAAYAAENLVVATQIALHYSSAVYFFVNPRNTLLASAIEQGFEHALADGSFQQLFQQNFSQALDNAELERRLVFELSNPLLPTNTPINRDLLWYRRK